MFEGYHYNHTMAIFFNIPVEHGFVRYNNGYLLNFNQNKQPIETISTRHDEFMDDTMQCEL